MGKNFRCYTQDDLYRALEKKFFVKNALDDCISTSKMFFDMIFYDIDPNQWGKLHVMMCNIIAILPLLIFILIRIVIKRYHFARIRNPLLSLFNQ